MPVPNWTLILVLTFLMGSAFNIPWLVYFSISVGLIFGLARFWKQHALDNVNYRRRWIYRRGFPGERLSLKIEVENKKLLPLTWLRMNDTWPQAVGPADESILSASHIPEQGTLTNIYSLRWYQRITRNFELKLRHRGVFQVGPSQFESGDLFGIFSTSKSIENFEYITVFPELLPREMLNLPTDDPFGDRAARQRLFEDPTRVMGIRDYRPEDGFRHVHWPATARTGQLQVKVYQPVSARSLIVCLNAATSPQPWLGVMPRTFEQIIKIAASNIYQAYQEGYAIGLISNGCLAHADQPFQFQPGRSPQQLALLLQALAGLTSYVVGPFETYLLKSVPRLPIGSSLVIISSLVTPQLLETLITLRRYRQHTTMVSLQVDPPPSVPGIQMVHLPFIE